jgi:hypothetical protein
MEHETHKYLIVVDGASSRDAARLFGPHILDVQVISAKNEIHAQNLFLATQPPRAKAALRDTLYVYDLEEMFQNMDAVEEKGGVPKFSFIQPGGKRPPKVAPLAERVQSKLSNETMTRPEDSQTVDHRPRQVPPKALPRSREEMVENIAKSPRQSEFLNREEVRTASNEITPEQLDILRKVGATETLQGAGEDVKPRVNAAIGNKKDNLNPVEASVPSNVTPEQAALLEKLQAIPNDANIVDDPSLREEIQEAAIHEDPELSSVRDDGVLTDDMIEELRKEVEEEKE